MMPDYDFTRPNRSDPTALNTGHSEHEDQFDFTKKPTTGGPHRSISEPYVRRGKEAFQTLEGDLPFGQTTQDITHFDPRKAAAHAITSVAHTMMQPGGVQQAINPANIAAKAYGDLINYFANPTVGATAENLTPDVKLPKFLQDALGNIPGGAKWAADPRGVARAAGDVAAALVPQPGPHVAKVVPRLEGEAAEKARGNIKAFERVGAPAVPAMLDPRAHESGIYIGQNPFIGGPVRRRIHETEKAVQRTAERFRKGTPERAGERIQKGLTKFQASVPEAGEHLRGERSGFRKAGELEEGKQSELTRRATYESAKKTPARVMGFGPKSAILYDKAYRSIGPLTHPIIADKTQAALGKISHAFDNPEFGSLFDEKTTTGIREILAGKGGQIHFEDLRRLRSSYRIAMRKALADPALRADLNEADVRSVYAAMSEDLRDGAYMLGKLWRGEKAGQAARKDWWYADTFYRGGMDRIDDALSKYLGTDDPAEAFHKLVSETRGGASQALKNVVRMKNSLPREDWQAVSSTIIDQMGRALPGQASTETEFSLNTFLTNLEKFMEPAADGNKMWDSGFKVLFEGAFDKGDQAQAVRDMETVASHYRELMRGRNVSLTAPHILGGALPITAAWAIRRPFYSVVALGGGYGVSQLMSSPRFMRWLARVPQSGTPEETARYTAEMKAWLATVGAATSIGQQRVGQMERGESGAEMPPSEAPPQPPPTLGPPPDAAAGAGMIGQ